jgi:hypothetical protein
MCSGFGPLTSNSLAMGPGRLGRFRATPVTSNHSARLRPILVPGSTRTHNPQVLVIAQLEQVRRESRSELIQLTEGVESPPGSICLDAAGECLALVRKDIPVTQLPRDLAEYLSFLFTRDRPFRDWPAHTGLGASRPRHKRQHHQQECTHQPTDPASIQEHR